MVVCGIPETIKGGKKIILKFSRFMELKTNNSLQVLNQKGYFEIKNYFLFFPESN